jgi:hypothetical protein
MPSQVSSVAQQEVQTGRKLFTLGEANRALPYLKRIVDDIVSCYREAVGLREQLERRPDHTQMDQLRSNYESLMDRLNDLIDELHQVGVELKDFEKGLIDFPARHEDRDIYFTWQRDEPTVHSWHPRDIGYASRQDVTTLGMEPATV